MKTYFPCRYDTHCLHNNKRDFQLFDIGEILLVSVPKSERNLVTNVSVLKTYVKEMTEKVSDKVFLIWESYSDTPVFSGQDFKIRPKS